MKFLEPEKGLTKRLCSVIGVDDAIIGGAAVGAAGNIFSSIFGSSAAKEQAEAIKYAANKASETALTMNSELVRMSRRSGSTAFRRAMRCRAFCSAAGI